ncbi:MAG: OmpA family protein [Zoogloeaceae bacterium]|jgi:outer membrane protein OmpA-like peptidoglycan-associated protein|nr:OmpA family protein [Zoogloeaceae bacterium]
MKKSWGLLFSLAVFLAAPAPAAPAAGSREKAVPSQAESATEHPLLDVASVYNGGYGWVQGDNPTPGHGAALLRDQISLINSVVSSSGVRPLFLTDAPGANVDLIYELAAPATIEYFRVRGKQGINTPRKVEFAVSQSPQTGFQPVAAYEIPEKYARNGGLHAENFDFSIPANRKISARYIRLTLRGGGKSGAYEFRYFNAYGRFDQPARLRENFGGVYSTHQIAGYSDSPKGHQIVPAGADAAMSQARRDGASYIILNQREGQVQGCYVIAGRNGRNHMVRSVEGDLNGGAEGNLFRFTRAYAKDGSQKQGVITLSPTGREAHLAMLRAIQPGDKADGFFRLRLTRVDLPISCAVSVEKEKTPVDAMKEAIDKTGKAQLYGVNFDFDSDVLRPESGAVLDDVVKLAQANPGWKFEIAGHTDGRGTDAYNQSLSERRAASVARYLTQAGVTASRLTARGYGKTRPLIPETNDSEAARAQNRRVELVRK